MVAKPTIAAPSVSLLVALVLSSCQSVGTTTAILYNDQGRHHRALDIARDVVAESPDDAEAHFQMAVAYSHLDSTALAYEHFQRSVELDAKNPRRRELAENNIAHNFSKHFTRGQQQFQQGAIAAAARSFETAVEADPRRGVGYYNLGVSYARLTDAAGGFRDDAVRAFKQAVRYSTPEDAFHADALAALVRHLSVMERWGDAVAWGERYVVLDAGNGTVWKQLSVCHDHLGNADRARECRLRSQQ